MDQAAQKKHPQQDNITNNGQSQCDFDLNLSENEEDGKDKKQ